MFHRRMRTSTWSESAMIDSAEVFRFYTAFLKRWVVEAWLGAKTGWFEFDCPKFWVTDFDFP